MAGPSLAITPVGLVSRLQRVIEWALLLAGALRQACRQISMEDLATLVHARRGMKELFDITAGAYIALRDGRTFSMLIRGRFASTW